MPKKKSKWKPTILFDESKLPDPIFEIDRTCDHPLSVPVDDKGFAHWCPTCGALQKKPGAKWKIPKGK